MKIIECPRDAMQGIREFIPTEKKAEYINSLLKIGFDTIDFGSFVSPKWIPQMKDTASVLEKLDLSATKTKLLSIVANQRGAQEAAKFEEIKYLGFPFSISETFQKLNVNATIRESLGRVEDISFVQDLCCKKNKTLVIYISMAFGNPYGDPWNMEIVHKWVEKLAAMDIKIIALSDTVGSSKPDSIKEMFDLLNGKFPGIEFGAHFHSTPKTWEEKISAAFESGCKRFDGAINGLGGCPMAEYQLVGNMATENLLAFFNDKNIDTALDMEEFFKSLKIAANVFPNN